jgi:hypothetical protein
MSNHSVLHYVFRVRRAPRFCCLIISAPVQAIALASSRPPLFSVVPAPYDAGAIVGFVEASDIGGRQQNIWAAVRPAVPSYPVEGLRHNGCAMTARSGPRPPSDAGDRLASNSGTA